MHFGTAVMRTYVGALRHVEWVLPLLEPRLYQTHSLRAFWSLLLPWPRVAFALYVVSTAATLVLAVRVWRSRSALTVRFSALLLATVLVSPHLTVYDLIILAPAFLLLGDWAVVDREQMFAPRIQQLLYLCYPLFLMGPLTQVTHLQLSVPAMTALLWTLWRVSSREVSSPPTTLPVSSRAEHQFSRSDADAQPRDLGLARCIVEPRDARVPGARDRCATPC